MSPTFLIYKMKEELTDFIGNPINIGDNIVLALSTYSRTPYLVTGVVKKIDTIKAKNGSIKSFRLYYFPIGSSCDTYYFSSGYYKEDIENLDPDDEENWTSFDISKNSFLNILKIV